MSYQQQAMSIYNTFNKELEKYPHLADFANKTGLPKQYLVLGAVGVYFFLIFLNIGGIGQLFANLVSVGIPAYYSLHALETAGTADDTQFLTYWVVYAFFTIIEFWSSLILYWVPLYWLIKTVFFLWLGLPVFGGAKVVYVRFIQPFSRNVLHIRGNGVAPNLSERTSASTTGATTGARF